MIGDTLYRVAVATDARGTTYAADHMTPAAADHDRDRLARRYGAAAVTVTEWSPLTEPERMAAPRAVDVTYHTDPDTCPHWRTVDAFNPATGLCAGHWPIDARTLPDEITYNGSDGGRHYARIIARHDDGSATIARGYYGTSRTTFTSTDDPQPFRGGY